MPIAFASEMEWRSCPRAPTYEVSECGDLRVCADADHRLAGKRLKGYITHDGYVAFNVKDTGKARQLLSHVMVAEAFLGPKPSPQHEVAHGNGSRICNHWLNLRWDTRKGNDEDCELHGTARKGEANGRATITEDEVRYIRRRYGEIKASGGKVSELDDRFGLHRSTIVAIATRKAWRHVP